MEFWRHGWTMDDWRNFPYILTSLKNFGFIDARTDEEIDDTSYGDQDIYASNTKTTPLKWKYDANANWTQRTGCLAVNFNTNTYGAYWGSYFGNNGIDICFADSVYYTAGYNLTANTPESNDTGSNYQTFFIPLKNNGFFFNGRIVTTDSNGYRIDNDHSTIPRLWTSCKDLMQNYEDTEGRTINLSTTCNWSCLNFLGIPVTQNLGYTNFLYLVLGKYKYVTTKDRYKISDGTITYDMTLHEGIPNFSQYEQVKDYYPGTKDQQAIQDAYYQSHIDMTRNVCTLVKYPYESVLLDNLFIMTTAPTTFTDEAGFFTINNRNFMKVFENLVVELPIN